MQELAEPRRACTNARGFLYVTASPNQLYYQAVFSSHDEKISVARGDAPYNSSPMERRMSERN